MSQPELRILNIGIGNGGEASPVSALVERYNTAFEVVLSSVDIDPGLNPDYVWDIRTKPSADMVGKFNVVHCSHTLEHIPYSEVHSVIKNLKECLVDSGELWVVVPSLEWLAKEIVMGRAGPWLMGFLYGAQSTPWEFHNSAFTLGALRQIMSECGLTVREAHQGWFGIGIASASGSSEVFNCKQNIVLGVNFR